MQSPTPLLRTNVKQSLSEAASDLGKYQDILSSDDSIAQRKRLRDGLAKEFDNYFQTNQNLCFPSS